MEGQHRQITPERRADHVDNLYLLGRLVILLPSRHAMRRSFVVMSIPDAVLDPRIRSSA